MVPYLQGFHYYFLTNFPDFSSFDKIPWLENAFPFFQVFPDFQSRWEPWFEQNDYR